MAVIIREKRTIEGKEYTVSVYKTPPGKLIGQEEKEQAEIFDKFLSVRMREIELEIEREGLLGLRAKKGKVLKLWYEVGKRLVFIGDVSLVHPEDKDFVWRAIYDHVDKIVPGPLSERAVNQPERSHFSYCYKISRFPWEFVESAGDWASWTEFFDRKETKNDSRIIEWIRKKSIEAGIKGKRNWLRPLAKLIHSEFADKDTSVFSEEQLSARLEAVMAKL